MTIFKYNSGVKIYSKPQLNPRLIILLVMSILTIRLTLGFFFTSASDITPDNVANAVNAERTKRNITPLNYNYKLAAAAQFKASDMIDRKYFAHVDPDGNYIWPKIIAEGYTPYSILGENLAVDFSDTDGLMAAWIDSPTHRDNILNSNFMDQGLGIGFGNPANGQASVAVANTFGAQPLASASKPVTPSPQQPATTQQKISAAPSSNVSLPAAQPKTQVVPNLPSLPVPKVQAQPQPQQIALQTENPQPSKTQQQTQPADQNTNPVIDASSVQINASVVDQNISLHISAKIAGQVTNADATLLNKSAVLKFDGSAYSGNLLFEKYIDYENQKLVISAINGRSGENSVEIPLQNLQLTSANPKDLINGLPAKAAKPDLYNVFKYIVIVFGGLFVIILFLDSVSLIKNEKKVPNISSGSSIIILLIISTSLLVSWWH
jgi:hypothetical protein